MAFWSDAAIMSRLGQHVPAQSLLDTMLCIPAKGLTNIAFPLQVAAHELARTPARDARAVLLSDCAHNADLARDLSRLGHGRLRRIGAYTEVAPALSDIFGP
ncbi:MAG: hypothetical protein ACRDPF_11415 [Streptosporangiaceae bacterium]